MDIAGHAAIVTGGASGLGAATARMLAEAGATASVKVTLGWKGDKTATSSAPEASALTAEA